MLTKRLMTALEEWAEIKAAREKLHALMDLHDTRINWPYFAEQSGVKADEISAALEEAAQRLTR
jgi:hypothetical protein